MTTPAALRTIVRVSRLPRLTFALMLAFAAPAVGVVLAPAAAHAEERDLAVGTELMATSDVTLHKAEIAKGSRVSVTKVTLHKGQIDAVNVALADGHVVKMTLAQVRSFFRVVAE
jgi:prepilin-type processing-associated H-X9-DG protein